MKRREDNKKVSLWKYVYISRLWLISFVFVTVALAFIAPLKSFIIQWLIDAPSKLIALRYSVLGVLITFLSFILELSSRNIWTQISVGLTKQLRDKIMSKYLNLNMESYLEFGNSEVLTLLINNVRMLQNDYYDAIYSVVLNCGMLLCSIGMLLYISSSMLLYILLLSVIPVLLPRMLDKGVLSSRNQHTRFLKEYTLCVTDTLKGYEIIRQFNVSDNYEKKHNYQNDLLSHSDTEFRKKMNLSISGISFVSNILFYFLLLLGILLFYGGGYLSGTSLHQLI